MKKYGTKNDPADEPCEKYLGSACTGFGNARTTCWMCGWDKTFHGERGREFWRTVHKKKRNEKLMSWISGERVLITGGSGSLGMALIKHLSNKDVQIRVFSRDEKKQYDARKLYPDVEYALGDIRDLTAVKDAVRDVDVVIHGASLKYVDISEKQPSEYVSTNVIGTMNLMDAVLNSKHFIRHCVGISSDKATNPVNTYGMTKALLEKLILEGSRRQGKGWTIFNVARYGNVAATRGSVIPFWKECQDKGLPLPITNPDMTRFFFTLDEAVELIEFCLSQPTGTVISKRMGACTLGDLAEVMKGQAGTKIVGERQGEKKHEMLLSEDEMKNVKYDGNYFIFDPTYNHIGELSGGYTSEFAPRLSQDQLKELVNKWT